ncbi:MAG: formate dehydrogenase accessory sulfurtransferase FdhD [Bacillota bacterium]|nr:formate dehydrogenase accessory sulfurtransferase FdhD [Bacillota bacterium]
MARRAVRRLVLGLRLAGGAGEAVRELRRFEDELAAEEPLEIRLVRGSLGERQAVATILRTPGDDFALAAGFLCSEGVLAERGQVARITYCVDPELDEEQRYNVVNVWLRSGVEPNLAAERRFLVSSACGACGKGSIEQLRARGLCPLPSRPGALLPVDLLAALPGRLRAVQRLFDRTGGLHAAGLFDGEGRLLAAAEDVGRHNAVDKVIGRLWLEGRLPLRGDRPAVLQVSGRAGFEIVQKAAVVGIPVVASVSAPSSLAVETAEAFGITLVGFSRGDRLNVYTHPERVRLGGTSVDGLASRAEATPDAAGLAASL